MVMVGGEHAGFVSRQLTSWQHSRRIVAGVWASPEVCDFWRSWARLDLSSWASPFPVQMGKLRPREVHRLMR